jgi:hypothetical protein
MNMSLLPKNNPEAERRRALAKVYSLLLNLAGEEEYQSPLTHIIVDEEEPTKPNSISPQPDIPP